MFVYICYFYMYYSHPLLAPPAELPGVRELRHQQLVHGEEHRGVRVQEMHHALESPVVPGGRHR